MEIKRDGDFKFTPSSFRYLKRRRLQYPCRAIETGMQLKNNALYHHSQILIHRPANIHSPLMWLVPYYIHKLENVKNKHSIQYVKQAIPEAIKL